MTTVSTAQYPATLPAGSAHPDALDVSALANLAWPTDSAVCGDVDVDDAPSRRTQHGAGLAARALGTVCDADADPEAAITDLVANLAHLADALHLNWHIILSAAVVIYDDQLNDDQRSEDQLNGDR